LAKKHKQLKSRISKSEEKRINEKIALGIGLTFIFVALFLLTWLIAEQEGDNIYTPDKNFSKMTPKEKINYVQEQEQETEDQSNYQLAIALGDSGYCEEIQKLSLRLKCEKEVPGVISISKKPKLELTESEISDNSDYQLAITMGDSKYCEQISNKEIKDKCLLETKG